MADNILIANELVDEAKRKKIETIMFKVDFDKAFDSIGTIKPPTEKRIMKSF